MSTARTNFLSMRATNLPGHVNYLMAITMAYQDGKRYMAIFQDGSMAFFANAKAVQQAGHELTKRSFVVLKLAKPYGAVFRQS